MHHVKPVPVAIQIAEKEWKDLSRESREVLRILSKSVEQYSTLQDTMSKQKDLYQKKIDAEFDILIKMIEARKLELRKKVCTVFDTVLDENKNLINGLSSAQDRLQFLVDAQIEWNTDEIKIVHWFDDVLNFI